MRAAALPTLEQALNTIAGRSVPLIEHKAGRAEEILAVLEGRIDVDAVVVQSFDWEFLAACRARSATVVLGALGERALGPDRLERAVAAGASVIGWNRRHVDRALVERVHARGLKLWVYTVNDEAEARALVALGVDGLITDRPAALRVVVRGAGR
ncbi:MAG: glycerophosphodiester phosphodiesterase [Planctomycetota bacterium]|nr:glycerophosphodiester phosphodiesterase [Planctomycetota bacterium]